MVEQIEALQSDTEFYCEECHNRTDLAYGYSNCPYCGASYFVFGDENKKVITRY